MEPSARWLAELYVPLGCVCLYRLSMRAKPVKRRQLCHWVQLATSMTWMFEVGGGGVGLKGYLEPRLLEFQL